MRITEIHPPLYTSGKFHRGPGPHAQAEIICAWCHEVADIADAIPWRRIDGHLVETKLFHSECWGDALRSLNALFHVAEQLHKAPKDML